jgi:hypothetical protein
MSTHSHLHHVHHHAKKVVAHVKEHQRKYLFAWWVASGTFLAFKIIMFFAASYSLYSAQHYTSFADEFFMTLHDEQTVSVEENEDVSSVSVDQSSESLVANNKVISLLLSSRLQNTESVPETTETPSENITENSETPAVIPDTLVSDSELSQDDSSDLNWSLDQSLDLDQENNQSPLNEDQNLQPSETTFTICSYEWFSSTVLSWFTYSGFMDIQWTIASACANEEVEIQLYDHNEQWISLTDVPWTTTNYLFDTTLLGSWFYTHTWIDSQWNPTILTGIYSWTAMSFWTWYRLRWIVQWDNILHETAAFAIDNQLPTISAISLSSSGFSSGFVSAGYTIEIAFDASELLTWVQVIVWDSAQASFSRISGNRYFYTYTLPQDFSSGGYIEYTISFRDLIWFSWSVNGVSQLFYDIAYPEMTWFTLSGYTFSFTSSKPVSSTLFVLISDTTSWRVFTSSNFSTQHSFSLPTLSLYTRYDMWIIIKDMAGNEGKAAFALGRNASGVIEFTLLATMYWGEIVTYASGASFLILPSTTSSWTVSSGEVRTLSFMKDKFTKELDNFAQCRNALDYTEIKLQIKWNQFTLHIPVFEREDIKTIVNWFILYIMKSVEDSSLDDQQLQDIARKFDNFTVILKLLRENDNVVCKQNLSNYHLEQFRQSLKDYWIQL